MDSLQRLEERLNQAERQLDRHLGECGVRHAEIIRRQEEGAKLMKSLGEATVARFEKMEADAERRGGLYLAGIESVTVSLTKLQLSVGAAIIVGLLGILFRKFNLL